MSSILSKNQIVMSIRKMSFYKDTVNTIGKFVPTKFQPLWNHPAGPQTIFFWAPTVKWGLVLAGIGDIKRTGDRISSSQALSLAVTGIIWSRYSVVIIPVNYNLLSVNLFMSLVQMYQLYKAVDYHYSTKK